MPPFRVQRLGSGLIIRPHMDPRMGANVQGPSLIRVPEWVKQPLGRYYLYFADHSGSYIRLAHADAVPGPYRMHTPGALSLERSLYPAAPARRPADAAPPPELPGIAPAGTPDIPSPEDEATTPHIASPDVHVDHANRRIVMYFHGLAAYRTQATRVALSVDGIDFAPLPELLGPSYFRAFRHGGATYALAMPGIMYRSADGLSTFVRGPDVFGEPLQRHTALLTRGDTLFVFWTRVGDAPERILVSGIDLSGDWRGWRARGAGELLRPGHDFEGARLPVEPSWRGAINRPVNQLRDPAIFEEDGRTYLLYAVQGEGGIAIAELLPGR